ncbi:hypothetical protein [Streptomyces otsuchiensis]|uniref:hypothetical protein n=1 Tax=Streptomyces otsuchiensis TaxID=2681388 RepID=UPI001300A3B6|nr:hypothetical protein [Streptomyces otsuchiensis]
MALLHRQVVTAFEPAERYGARQPVLLVESSGPAPLSELFDRFGRGEAGIAVLNTE